MQYSLVRASDDRSLACLCQALWLRRCDHNLFGLEGVIVEAVPIADWYSVFGLRLVDFSRCFAQWAFHLIAGQSRPWLQLLLHGGHVAAAAASFLSSSAARCIV
jgi:hypothetical protein